MVTYKLKYNDMIIADKIKIAQNFYERLIGLLKHKKLDDGEGLLISQCKQIHTIGMKFNIDVVFLSKERKVLYIENNIKPGRVSKFIKNADKALELKAGTAADYSIMAGKIVKFEL